MPWITDPIDGKNRCICPECGRIGDYNDQYDSAYCSNCLIWLEKACSCGPEEGCPYVGRPEKPNAYW